MSSNILDYFPAHLTPRPGQVEALQLLEADWDRFGVFVLGLPVASGKSAIAQCISRWVSATKKSKAITLAPTNMLVAQYLKDYPRLPALHGAASYLCQTVDASVKVRKAKKLGLCKDSSCKGCREYTRDRRRIYAVPYALANYHTFLANKLAKVFGTVIADEAHTLVPILASLGSSRLWRHKLPPGHRWPEDLDSTSKLVCWLGTLPEELRQTSKSLSHFIQAAESDKYIFRRGLAEYEGEDEECLTLVPLYLTEEPGLFFTPSTRKVILMSATISPADVEQLGLGLRRVRYITASSSIPPESRPLISVTNSPSLAYREQEANLPETVRIISEILARYPLDKGLLHAPYSLAQLLRRTDLGANSRIIFHDKKNKKEVYTRFRMSKEPLVLVASGMYEGVDLPFDEGRFQVVTKIPFPSLAEPAVLHRSRQEPAWYTWETVKLVRQAVGRICRGPEDWGHTYILDYPNFRRIYSNKDFWPGWEQEAVYDDSI